jgi:hypothetical protein
MFVQGEELQRLRSNRNIRRNIVASKSGIVPQGATEIIPSTEMPQFNEALAKMDSLELELEPLSKEARELKITDKPSRERAGVLNAQFKAMDKTTEATMGRYDLIVDRVRDFIKTRKLRVKNRTQEGKEILRVKMGDWDRAEEAATKAEEDRKNRELQANLDRQAEEKRQADEKAAKELKDRRVAEIRQDLKDKKITKRQAEKLLREAGAMEESLLAKAAADQEEAKTQSAKVVETVKVETNVPVVPGNVRRKNWRFRVVNAQQVKMRYLCPDEVKIGAEVRKLTKDSTDQDKAAIEMEVGGIEIYDDRTY